MTGVILKITCFSLCSLAVVKPLVDFLYGKKGRTIAVQLVNIYKQGPHQANRTCINSQWNELHSDSQGAFSFYENVHAYSGNSIVLLHIILWMAILNNAKTKHQWRFSVAIKFVGSVHQYLMVEGYVPGDESRLSILLPSTSHQYIALHQWSTDQCLTLRTISHNKLYKL